jgi:hypothetical protein
MGCGYGSRIVLALRAARNFARRFIALGFS